jgi:hypothetical protein
MRSCRDHCFCQLQAPLADLAMRRHTYCRRKRAGEVKDAETRDVGEISDANIITKMIPDILEDTLQASIIELMPCLDWQANGTSIPMREQQSRGKHPGRCFHEHASGGSRAHHLR